VPTLELAFRAEDAPGWPSWLLIALVLLAMPAALASRRAIVNGAEMPAPGALYGQAAVNLSIVGVVALLAARDLGLAVASRPAPTAWAWVLGGAVLAGMLAMALVVWRVTPAAERERGAAFLPRNARERALVVGVACLAGVAEELAWRAALPALLDRWTGDAWLAVGLSALSFGLGHAVQGRLAMAVVFATALVFQLLVEASGGLWVAVAVHAAYDLLAVLWLSPYLRGRSGASP
jgi:membrane protease YdiL (CAAX protease family)